MTPSPMANCAPGSLPRCHARELAACAEEIGEWVTGKRSDPFHGIVRRHGIAAQVFAGFAQTPWSFIQDAEGEDTAVSACLADTQGIERRRHGASCPRMPRLTFVPQRLQAHRWHRRRGSTGERGNARCC